MLTERFRTYSTPVLKQRLRLSLVALWIVWVGAGFSSISALIKGEQDLLIASCFFLLISIFAYQQKQEIVQEIADRTL